MEAEDRIFNDVDLLGNISKVKMATGASDEECATALKDTNNDVVEASKLIIKGNDPRGELRDE